KVILTGGPKSGGNYLQSHQALLRYLFLVSQVEVRDGAGADSRITVERADGKKCQRCWNYSTRVGENSRYPTVCERCSEALAEIESDRTAGVAAN
ncbi:MAG TPA: zinc finger domain-containing protein, partial [Candidatus Dormibacteraeota bacterium]|nr:zinc finger domain-containing protein [Candidatus Dormibacteraeota bacterium]